MSSDCSKPYAMGYLGVESAYKLLSGQGSSLERTVDTSTKIVDRRNLFTMDSQKRCSLLSSEPLSKTHNFFSLCFGTLLYWHNFYPSFGEIYTCFSSCLLIKLNM